MYGTYKKTGRKTTSESMIPDTMKVLFVTKGIDEHVNGCHKTRNGWYLGLVAPISSLVELLILYS